MGGGGLVIKGGGGGHRDNTKVTVVLVIPCYPLCFMLALIVSTCFCRKWENICIK